MFTRDFGLHLPSEYARIQGNLCLPPVIEMLETTNYCRSNRAVTVFCLLDDVLTSCINFFDG